MGSGLGFFGTVLHFVSPTPTQCGTVQKKHDPGKPRPQSNSRLSTKKQKHNLWGSWAGQELKTLHVKKKKHIDFFIIIIIIIVFCDTLQFGVWACQVCFSGTVSHFVRKTPRKCGTVQKKPILASPGQNKNTETKRRNDESTEKH